MPGMNAPMLMVLASLLFSLMGVCVKLASTQFGTGEIVMYRGLVGAVVMAVLANTVAKSAMVLGLGSSELRRLMLPVSLGLLALGAAGLWLLL